MSATLDETVRYSIRRHRADPSDVRYLASLVVALWRAEAFASGRGRPVQVLFRLSGGLSRADVARGQSHPWRYEKPHHRRKNHNRGLWWTVGPGSWTRPDGRAWIMPAPDSGAVVWSNAQYTKPFASIGELAEYLVERALEWRVLEEPAIKVCRRCSGTGKIKLGRNEGVKCPTCLGRVGSSQGGAST